ncbi:unnamed protein product [Moneuplotes crassus]|uniref:Uncharacterized protein n=1 Tax=Euplotes crassus TaxID=5936 RepID=A0AAD1U5L0_EUPCR|nr:unnamed protein product [Moneuplotes crassus]
MKPANTKSPTSVDSPNGTMKNLFDSHECNVDEDISSEIQANHVYDSSMVIKIRNSLIIYKCSRKRDFCNSMPQKSITKRHRISLEKSKTIYAKKDPQKTLSCKRSQGKWENSRKSSIEILLKLQEKLAGMKNVDLKKTKTNEPLQKNFEVLKCSASYDKEAKSLSLI